MSIDVTQPTAQDSLTLQELSLHHAITDYRASLGLAALPLSAALTTTAGRHVADWRENIWAAGVTLPADANLHSWSDAYYYDDHRNPRVMWDAPQRVGTGYASAGYEISAAGFATTDAALAGWIASPSHNAILAGLGPWAGIELEAIGIGVDTSPGAGIYAGRIFHVWFGEAADAAVPRIFGTLGADEVRGTAFADRVFGLDGDDVIRGGFGDDELRGDAGDDRLNGGVGYDVIGGGAGNDGLWGSSGNDVINGGDGADRLWGEEGGDRMVGALGDDILIGGPGRDVMTGGGGADVFVFNAASDGQPGAQRAVVTDFGVGADRIDLSRLDADAATGADDAFRYVGRAGFSGAAGELRHADGLVEADLDGDAAADFQLDLGAAATLAAVDFLL